jgi:hypothetical protein
VVITMAESSGRAFLANWSSYDAPFRTKARLAVANSWKKLRTGSGGAPMTDALEGRDLEAVARHRPSSDHPIRTAPSPRRVRAFLDDVAVVDSDRALLLEAMHLPVYYSPPRRRSYAGLIQDVCDGSPRAGQ